MGWTNRGERPVAETPWFRLNLAGVELPGGRRVDHYVLRLPPVVLAAVLDDARHPGSSPAARFPRRSRPPS